MRFSILRPRSWIFLLLAVLLAAYLLTGVVPVKQGERAVVRRFGRVLEEKPGPGLWIGLPWGMDRVDPVMTDDPRHVTVGYEPALDAGNSATPPGQLLTGDHNLVNVRAVINYTVIDQEIEQYVVQRERVDGLVARTTDTVLAEWVGGRTVDEVLLRGKVLLPPLLVEQVQERLRPYRLGIQVRGASVVLAAPDEVKHAFDAVNRADIYIRTGRTKAEQDAARNLLEAGKEKFRLEQQAAAYAAEQRHLAAADAAAFEKRLEAYRRLRQENPDYLGGIWWEEMGKLFAQMKKNGHIDLLDRHLGADGLDITVIPPLPKKR